VIAYRAMLDVSVELIRYVKRLLRKECKIRRKGSSRALTCWYQAVFAIA
jgi:hypothetical protein